MGWRRGRKRLWGVWREKSIFPFATPLPQTGKNGTNTDKFKENISFVFKPSFMGRGSSLRTLQNIGWLQKKGERRPAPPGSGTRHFRSNTCTGGRERGAVAASGEYHLSSFGASTAKRDFPHSLVPPSFSDPASLARESRSCN